MIVSLDDAPEIAHGLVAEHDLLLTDSHDWDTGEVVYGLRTLRQVYGGRSEPPWMPPAAKVEYRELIRKGRSNWLRLVVKVLAQRLIVDGFRSSTDRQADDATWERWQRNNLDSGQKRVYADMFVCGIGYTTTWPDLTAKIPRIRVQSPLQMHARPDPVDLDRIDVGIRRWRQGKGQRAALFDDEKSIPMVHVDGIWKVDGKPATHGLGQVPITAFPNELDSDGIWHSEMSPLIPIQQRIDETLLDRLVTQKFVAFPQKWATGYLEDEDEESIPAPVMALIDRMLTAESPDTKFGAFPAGDLKQYIDAVADDVRQMAALGQVPSHFLLGGIVDLSGLTAAEASVGGKLADKQTQAGERWEDQMRLAAKAAGDEQGARDWSSEVIWRNTSSQADSAIMDGLAKLKDLGVPLPYLLERLGLSQSTIDRIVAQQAEAATAQAAATARAYGIPTPAA